MGNGPLKDTGLGNLHLASGSHEAGAWAGKAGPFLCVCLPSQNWHVSEASEWQSRQEAAPVGHRRLQQRLALELLASLQGSQVGRFSECVPAYALAKEVRPLLNLGLPCLP